MKRRGAIDQGAGMGSVLLVVAVALTLVFALAGTSVTHLRVAQRADNSQLAHCLAESAIAAGLEKVLAQEDFGLLGQSRESIELPGPISGSRGIVTFHSPTAREHATWSSTNNLSRESAVPGARGRVVPGSALHLVGLGECRGTRRQLEAIFTVPRYPFVIASAGRFRSEGEMLVAGVERMTDLRSGATPSDEDLLPGHIISNSLAGDALQLGQQVKVTGDAKAAGGVRLEQGATVLGEVQNHASPTEIPDISVTAYDPQANGKQGIQHVTTSVVNQAVFEGWVRRQGDLFVGQGLKLDQGVLYVDGDLTVTGGVTGTGAIFVTGEANISGRSDLSSDNLTALMSTGGIELNGTGQSRSFFQGLIYTHGDFRASDITLVGTLMVKGTDSEMRLQNANVFYSPDSTRVDLEHPARTPLYFVSPQGANPGAFLGTSHSGNSGNLIKIFVSLSQDGRLLLYFADEDDSQARVAADPEGAVSILRDMIQEAGGETDMNAFEAAARRRLPDLLSDIEDGTLGPQEPATDLLTVDPSRFLRLEDRIRMVLMREI